MGPSAHDGDEHRRHRDPFAWGLRKPEVVERYTDAVECEARRLVERRRDGADRRLNALHVTPAGREVLQTGLETLTAAHEDLARPIGEEGDRELRSLLRKLLS